MPNDTSTYDANLLLSHPQQFIDTASSPICNNTLEENRTINFPLQSQRLSTSNPILRDHQCHNNFSVSSNQYNMATSPICCNNEQTSLSKSYADVLKSNQNQSRNHLPSLIILPKENMTNSQLQENLEKYNPISKLGVKINKISYMRKGGLVVSCSNKEDINKINTALENNDKIKQLVTLKIPTKRTPKCSISNLAKSTSANEIVDIISKNFQINNSDIKPIFKLNDKRNNAIKWIIECTPYVFKILMSQSIFHHGWRSHRITEFFGVRRCFNCQDFEHSPK
ncbi:hypothetical protein X975_14059, partial [Stegodyphus mimosarum]